MRRQVRSFADCLVADDKLARLTDHAQRLLRLQRAFEAASPLARHARVANLKLGKVVIYAANAAVAAKLRQLASRLTGVFCVVAAEVTGTEIRVQPSANNDNRVSEKRRAKIGENQKQGLTSLAGRLPEGSPLRAALRRLVDRSH